MKNFNTMPGFQDQTSDQVLKKDAVISKIKDSFKSYGFLPIETPLIESVENFNRDYCTNVETFDVVGRDPKEPGGTLRYDQTVPMGLYAKRNKVPFPFSRYVIGDVFRNETEDSLRKGKLRQFTQCDVDTIGENLPLEYDGETIVMIANTLQTLRIPSFEMSVSNRKILYGLLESIGIEKPNDQEKILGILDEQDKIGKELIEKKLLSAGLSTEKTGIILKILTLTGKTNEETIKNLQKFLAETKGSREGVEELLAIAEYIKRYGQKINQVIKINPTIVRGLGYYTGMVFETLLKNDPKMGSISSGGRFKFENMSGSGGSIGLERVIDLAKTTESDEIPLKEITLSKNPTKKEIQEIESLRKKGVPVKVSFSPDKS